MYSKVFMCVFLVTSCRASSTFEKDHNFQGKVCSPISYDFGDVVRPLFCAVMCKRQTDCHGFFHDANLRSCHGINYSLYSTSGCTTQGNNQFYRKAACGAVPVYQHATVDASSGMPRQFTCHPKYQKTVPYITCDVDTVTQIATWNPSSGICTEMYGSVCTSDGDCAEIDGTCVGNQCTCASNKAYNTTQMYCVERFKLMPGTGGDGITSGQLHMLHNGQWGNVCLQDWSWTATKAICQDINQNFTYGGAFHKSDVFGSGLAVTPSYEMKDLDCGTTGAATSIASCTYTELKTDCDHNKDIGLTCYENDITGNIRLNSDFTKSGLSSEHRLEVFYNGTWGTVCKEDWGSSSAIVACRSLLPNVDPGDISKNDCTDSCTGGPGGPYVVDGVKCDGDEPHFFYCINRGWARSHSCPGHEVGLYCEVDSK